MNIIEFIKTIAGTAALGATMLLIAFLVLSFCSWGFTLATKKHIIRNGLHITYFAHDSSFSSVTPTIDHPLYFFSTGVYKLSIPVDEFSELTDSQVKEKLREAFVLHLEQEASTKVAKQKFKKLSL